MTPTPTDALPLFTLARESRFRGRTYSASQDGARLASQLDRVRALMLDGRWRTLSDIQAVVGGKETAVSARLRDLRRPFGGGHKVERRRVSGGLWEYRVVVEEVA